MTADLLDVREEPNRDALGLGSSARREANLPKVANEPDPAAPRGASEPKMLRPSPHLRNGLGMGAVDAFRPRVGGAVGRDRSSAYPLRHRPFPPIERDRASRGAHDLHLFDGREAGGGHQPG